MTSGILLLDKKEGISSGKCVYKARKKLGIKKIGHAGTLDPLATGLLPLLVGKATRVSDFLMADIKEYETLAYFGEKTDSQDKTGQVIERSLNSFTRSDLEKAIKENFLGEILQTPPMYSAIKHKGQKLYELARKGQSVERKKRRIKIYDFEILDFNFPYAKFRIKCSKGTYIRTLVNDLGEVLKTFANVHELRRTRVGEFDVKDAVSFDDLENLKKEQIEKYLMPIDHALVDLKKVVLDKRHLKHAINGMAIKKDFSKSLENQNLRVYVEDNFIGIGRYIDGAIKLKKVFYEG